MKRCPMCGKLMFTAYALEFHIIHIHHVHRSMTPPAEQPATPRLCLICEGATRGADAFCGECQRMPEDERHTAVKHMVEVAELSDWDTHDASHPEHMLDRNEPPRKHWYAVVTALVAHHGFVLDDGAGYGE